MGMFSILKGALGLLFGREAEAKTKPQQLTDFEQELFEKALEFYNTGHIAFLVVLIPAEDGPLSYINSSNQLVNCEHDYLAIQQGGNPYRMMEIYKSQNIPVLMAFDIQTHGHFKNLLPEGWTPGTLNIDSNLFANPIIRLQDEKSYAPQKVKIEIDEASDTLKVVSEPVEEDISPPRPSGPRVLTLVVDNTTPKNPSP